MAKSYVTLLIMGGMLFFSSCFSNSSLMTYSRYDQVETGALIEEVEVRMGKPYAIHQQKDGVLEYEYVERINAGNNLVAENHYFLIVQEGKVVGKYMTRARAPTYDLIYQEQPNYPGNLGGA